MTDAWSALRDRVGQEVGVSDWLAIDQEMIDAFSRATLDPDPMHVDPAWCARYSPFRRPIAFGFQTISLLTFLSHQALGWMHEDRPEGGGYGLNYGFDRVRLIEPVPVGSRIRARFTLLAHSEPRPGEIRSTLGVTVEIEGRERPALVAEWLGLWIADPAGHRRIEARHGG
jgi:acyl dehydratase